MGRTASAVTTGLVLLAVVATALLVVRLQELVLVLLIAVVLGEGLWPLVEVIERRGLPRAVSAALVYAAILSALAIFVVLLARPVVAEARLVLANLPLYQSLFQRNFSELLAQLSIDGSVAPQVGSSLESIARAAFSVAAALFRGVVDVIVILLLSVLWLFSRGSAGRFALSLLPPAGREHAVGVWKEIDLGLAGYVRGVAINMVVIGVATGIAAALLGLPAPALLGLLAGLTEMIPIAGPIIGAIPAILLGFTISPYHPLLVALVYLVIQQVEAHTLVPLVMRHSVGLPALVVVVALAAGATLGGVGGAVIAVPVAFMVHVVVVRIVAPWIRARHAVTAATSSRSADPRSQSAPVQPRA
jgi:predicted PurR-regulated permease PerM